MTAEHSDDPAPPTAHLDLAVDLDGSASRIVLRGELDEETAAVLTCVVEGQVAHGRTDVQVDLAELVFFDLRGFAALYGARATVERAGGRLRLVNGNDLVQIVAAWWGVPDLLDGSPSSS
jgi:anti-anti-sigma factor